ncbi:uncharacterized protein LOC128018259 isoform X2 [Carassius gibelio]|uniref:uncharacterized protein LOC128018259 isoform X2 n=1 Tax=Carassius gibelio TaxID=101364 RepID=UPI00227968B1|nr:uncharacterized protein LOC128018259 isoform X2 [Carassius gibelio]
MPASFMGKLQNGERPSCSERRQLVRIVASEILEVSKCPAKKHVSEIARQMVIAYPKSFRDEINSQVVGSGYDSLLKQLVCRIDNLKRAKAISIPLCGTLEVSTKKRKLLYGCINSDPQLLVGETSELQQEKKEKLVVMFQNNESDVKTIYDLMTSTYTPQRNSIQSGKETKDLLDEWPYLFQPAGMKAHFKELTGIDINNSFEESASKDTSVPSDICSEQLPATPCIVVCGENPLTASVYMVAVDQMIINDHLLSFTEALYLMFSLYYILNISYPVELGAKLEFLQRCIFRINPHKGTKVEKREKKRAYSVNPRVLSLTSKIAAFDWGE